MFSWCEAVLAVIVIIFSLVSAPASKWILFAAGILLLVHAFFCRYCKTMCCKGKDMKMPKKKRR